MTAERIVSTHRLPDRATSEIEGSRHRLALFSVFFFHGIAMSSWITRTPAIRDQLAASTGEMGLVIFSLSVGSMLSLLAAGALLKHLGTRPILIGGVVLIGAGLALIGVGAKLGEPLLVASALFLIGLALGSSEVAANVDGSQVERDTGRTVLPIMHGSFSLGTVVGSLFGIVATSAEVAVELQLTLAAVAAAPFAAFTFRGLPKASTAAAGGDAAPEGKGLGRHHDRTLLMIGAIVLAMALAEGAANDWLPLLMVDGHGYGPAAGSLVFTLFAAAMTIGRFGGAFVVDRFGRAAAVRASALTGAVGIATVVFADDPVVAGAAVVLWGLGASLGFPVAMSAAGASGTDSVARVRIVAVVGYCAFLVGPPLLGFLGDHVGLRLAMIFVLALVLSAIPLSSALGSGRDARDIAK